MQVSGAAGYVRRVEPRFYRLRCERSLLRNVAWDDCCLQAQRSRRRAGVKVEANLLDGQVATGCAGVSPWRCITSPIAARSGGPPAAAARTWAMSRK